MSELYTLPDGWEWKKLRDKVVCELIMGQSPSSDTYNSDGIGIPFFQGKTEFGEIYPRVSKYCTTPNKIAQIGDILLSVRAPVGPTNIANIECCIGRGLGAIRPNSKNTLTNYLLYFFRNFEIEISNKGKGSTFPAITKKELEEINIPLPPLKEQKRIVAKLDNLFAKIDKAIALHQKNIDEADIFMASVLNDVFVELEEKYEKKILGNLTKTTSGGTPSRNQKSYWNGTIGWLKSGELNDGYITEVEEYITEEGLNKSSAKLFPKGTLLIAMYGATVGRLGILKIKTTTNQAICGILNDKKEFETLYMFYFLKKSREKMIKDSFGGAQPNISQTYIKELEIPLPPLQTQQKVVSYLDEISQKMEKIKNLQKEKMQSLKELKASILDKAFKGEL